MTIVVSCAALLLMGAPWWVFAVGILLAHAPAAGLVAVGAGVAYELVVHHTEERASASDAARFLRTVADDLGVGRTLLEVVRDSHDPVVDRRARRLAAAGAAGTEIADAIAPRLGRHGPGFRAAVALSEVTGGSLARALYVLADQADLDADSARDRRVATSQARFTAVVVGGVPLVIAVAVVVLRGVPEPGGALVVVPMTLGAVLMVVGTVLVAWMSRSVAAR